MVRSTLNDFPCDKGIRVFMKIYILERLDKPWNSKQSVPPGSTVESDGYKCAERIINRQERKNHQSKLVLVPGISRYDTVRGYNRRGVINRYQAIINPLVLPNTFYLCV